MHSNPFWFMYMHIERVLVRSILHCHITRSRVLIFWQPWCEFGSSVPLFVVPVFLFEFFSAVVVEFSCYVTRGVSVVEIGWRIVIQFPCTFCHFCINDSATLTPTSFRWFSCSIRSGDVRFHFLLQEVCVGRVCVCKLIMCE